MTETITCMFCGARMVNHCAHLECAISVCTGKCLSLRIDRPGRSVEWRERKAS